MNRNDEDVRLAPGDRRLVETIEKTLRPAPMTLERERAFRRAILEATSPRERSWWVPVGVVAATAATAALAWLSATDVAPRPVDVAHRAPAAAAPEAAPAAAPREPEPAIASSEEALEDGEMLAAEEASPADYLPDEYVVLARYFDVDTLGATFVE